MSSLTLLVLKSFVVVIFEGSNFRMKMSVDLFPLIVKLFIQRVSDEF